ncbi:MAG TPA: tetratricopeptide repeat protein, partial [Thermoanaerobaculia bacterium]|nr:tetratricopeptide repeat protein [Thermoanaerobaculia bacterium]
LYEFGPFRLEARERRLWNGEDLVPLPPKVFDTLVLLVENAGHVVTKSELMASLWPGTAVEEGNLTKNIWLIRRALGESEGENRYIETVPKAGYRFVAPLREAAEAPPAPDPAPSPSRRMADDSPLVPARPPRRRMPVAARIAIAAGLCVVIALAAFLSRHRPIRSEAPGGGAAATPPIPARRSVAVLGFRNLSGRPDAGWLSTAVSEMMSAELAAGEKLRLVPAESVSRVGGVRSPPSAGTLSRETLANLRASLDADMVLSGSYVAIPSADGGALRFDMTLQDTGTGESLVTVTETGSAGNLFDLVAAAGNRLRSGLGLDGASPAGAGGVAASLPNDPGAARAYAEGLAKFREFDALGARPLLEASIRVEPNFGPAHEALSRTWSALGYDGNARTEAEEAFRLASGSAPAAYAAAEARLAEAQTNWKRAESLNATIVRAHPDDLEAGLRLAAVQIEGGRAREALTTLSALGKLRAPARDDPRIDLTRADAFAALSRSREELSAAESAAGKAMRNGSALLVAEARLHQAWARGSAGDRDGSRKSYEAAVELFRGAGDSNGEAQALVGIANTKSEEGKYNEWRELLQQAQAIFVRIGNRKGESHVVSDLAILDWLRGDVESALSESRQVLAINRSINDPRGIVWGLNATGNVLADQGQFQEALALQKEGVGISRTMGDDGSLGYGLSSLGDTFLAEGLLDAAQENYEQALALSKKLGDPASEAAHESDLGNVFFEGGKLGRAEAHYENALAGRRKLGLKDDIAETQMLISGLRNTEGRYAEAARLSSESARVFADSRQTGNGAISLANQARAETGLGKVADARAL